MYTQKYYKLAEIGFIRNIFPFIHNTRTVNSFNSILITIIIIIINKNNE